LPPNSAFERNKSVDTWCFVAKVPTTLLLYHIRGTGHTGSVSRRYTRTLLLLSIYSTTTGYLHPIRRRDPQLPWLTDYLQNDKGLAAGWSCRPAYSTLYKFTTATKATTRNILQWRMS